MKIKKYLKPPPSWFNIWLCFERKGLLQMQKKMWKDLVKNQHGWTMCQFPKIYPKTDFQPASCFLHKNSLQLLDKNEHSSAERASLSSHSRTSTQTHLGYGRFVNVGSYLSTFPKRSFLPPLHFCFIASRIFFLRTLLERCVLLEQVERREVWVWRQKWSDSSSIDSIVK